MRTLIATFAGLLAASAALPAAAQYYGGDGYRGGEIVRCESEDGRTRECPTGGGRIVLERQISRAPCIEGRSWGDGRSGVWVSQGCRGEFALVRGGGWDRPDYGYGGRVFRCESNDGRHVECAANTRAGVQLVRQLSRSACIEGRTWGYGRGGIWVAQGCRAEFRSY